MAAKKLRLLFLTYQGDGAGSTQSIYFLTTGLAERGHEVYLGIRQESLLWSLVEGSKVHRVAMSFKSKFDTHNWKQIKDVVREHDIQIINAQSSYDRYTSIFAKIRYGLKCKIVHTRRQMPLSTGGLLQKLFLNKHTDGIVAVSQPVANAMIGLGAQREKVTIIHNGTPSSKYECISPERTSALRSKFEIKEEDIVIGCVSRMKEQVQIIKALAQVQKPLKMIFCGIEATTEMKEIIDRYTVDHKVFFEGKVPAKDVLSYYPLFTMHVLASTMEGLSQSLLEAMALGVPVIATAYAGNLDLIQDEVNGLLFEDGDIDQLAKNINLLISNTEIRERLTQQGKTTALVKFNIDKTISNYKAYFARLLSK